MARKREREREVPLGFILQGNFLLCSKDQISLAKEIAFMLAPHLEIICTMVPTYLLTFFPLRDTVCSLKRKKQMALDSAPVVEKQPTPPASP